MPKGTYCEECQVDTALHDKKNKLCRRCYYRKYYETHKERWKIYVARQGKEKKRMADKQYREKCREEIRAKRKLKSEEHKKWMKKYHERNREQGRQYRKQDIDRIRENVRQWRRTPNGKACMRRQRFKRRAELNSKDINRVIQENLLKYGAFCCEKCKRLTGNGFHLDHITPIAKGGNNSYENLQLLCPDCNIQKRTQVADYRENGFLTINF